MMIDAEMYGMIPSANTEKRDSAPPENMLNRPEDAALLRVEQLPQLIRVDARHRDVRANPIDEQRHHQEDQATLQVAVLSRAADRR